MTGNGTGNSGTAGGNSTFGSLLTVFGAGFGFGGQSGATNSGGGSGATCIANGANGTGSAGGTAPTGAGNGGFNSVGSTGTVGGGGGAGVAKVRPVDWPVTVPEVPGRQAVRGVASVLLPHLQEGEAEIIAMSKPQLPEEQSGAAMAATGMRLPT